MAATPPEMKPPPHHSFSSDERSPHPSARVITITSGRGGLGKTNIALNLAIVLSSLKKRVCLVDVDKGRTNAGVMVGLESEYSIEHVLNRQKSIVDVCTPAPGGIKILSVAPGLERLSLPDSSDADRFLVVIEELEADFDYIIVDTASDFSAQRLPFILSAQDLVVIISPDSTSIDEAFLLFKLIQDKGFAGNLYTLTNMVLGYDDSLEIFNYFNQQTKEKLSMESNFLGYVPMDHGLISAAICQVPIVLHKPDSIQSRCLTSAAKKFESRFAETGRASLSRYWRDYILHRQQHDPEESTDGVDFLEGAFPLPSPLAVGLPDDQVIDDLLPDDDEEQQEDEASFTPNQDQEPVRPEKGDDKCADQLADSEPAPDEEFVAQPAPSLKDFTIEEWLGEIAEILTRDSTSKTQARQLIISAEEAYSKRFDGPPHDLEELFAKRIDQENVSAESFKTLQGMIEEKYNSTYSAPLKEPSQVFAAMLDDGSATEEQLKKWNQMLCSHYSERFAKPVVSFDEMLNVELGNEELSEPGFNAIISRVKEAYLGRFGKEYQDPKVILDLLKELKGLQDKLDKFDQARAMVSEIIIESFDAQDDLENAITNFLDKQARK